LFSEGYLVTATKRPESNSTCEGLKIAVIIDTSYSMRSVKDQLENTLEWLHENPHSNSIHTYLTSTPAFPKYFQPLKMESIPSMDIINLVGFHSNYRMLSQFVRLSDGESYDMAMVLTDKGSFELAENHYQPLNIQYPVYFVHLDDMPIGYEDQTLRLLDQGGVASRYSSVCLFLTFSVRKKLYASM
jgi:hypothetical protein